MKLVIVPPAIAELQHAAAFYTAKANIELGLAFVAEFEKTGNRIPEYPNLGAAFRGKLRRYLFRRFPYSIIYQITPDELRIVAVAHHRRRPGYWLKR